jgi:Right handed beta helix region
LVADYTMIEGQGWSSAIQAHGMNSPSTGVIVNAGNQKLHEQTATANQGVVVRDVKVDANAGDRSNTSSSIAGVWLARCDDCLLEHIWATNARGSGIRLVYGNRNKVVLSLADNSTNIGIGVALEYDFDIDHNIARDNRGNGFDCGIGSAHGRYTGNLAEFNGANGFNPDTCGNLEFTANTAFKNANGFTWSNPQDTITACSNIAESNTGYGFYVTNNANFVTLCGDHAIHNGKDGFRIENSGLVSVVGGAALNNSSSSPNTYSGIEITTTAGGQHALNNTIIGVMARNVGARNWAPSHGCGLYAWIQPSPANSHFYQNRASACNTGGSQPYFPSDPGSTVQDGTCTWTEATQEYGQQKFGISEDQADQDSVGQNLITNNNLIENRRGGLGGLAASDHAHSNRTESPRTLVIDGQPR